MKVGIVGWRGMVGSVLLERMQTENDLKALDLYLFTTSQVGQVAPDFGQKSAVLLDASQVAELAKMDVVITCQGGDFTRDMHGLLRDSGWAGYWIDAASTLRMQPRSTIVLDPVNRSVIDDALARGERDFVGGNCTVSLMMMALAGLFREDMIEWISAMTYQAASGGGARAMRELVAQMGVLNSTVAESLSRADSSIIDIDAALTGAMRDGSLPTQDCGAVLAGSLIPWIDSDSGTGQSREEAKAPAETNKILARSGKDVIPVDGICVRVSSMRCHSQALTIKLRRDVPVDEIEAVLAAGNEWVTVVPNNRPDSIAKLSPAAVSGGLGVAIGRLRKMSLGPEYLAAFTVGDQLLWGAAEPLRRMLQILRERG